MFFLKLDQRDSGEKTTPLNIYQQKSRLKITFQTASLRELLVSKVGVAGNSVPFGKLTTSHSILYRVDIFTESFTKLERTLRSISFDRL